MGFDNSEIISIAVDFFKSAADELNPYTEDDSEIVVESPNTVAMYTPDYVQFAKYGRGSGKKPPLDPILNWVSKKGIIFEGSDERGTAFAIQAFIGKNGTLNYVPNAPNALEEALDNHYDEFLLNLSISTTRSINIEIKNIYADVFKSDNVLRFKI